jgi:4-hydroxybutyrate dehydrogenase
MAILTFNTKVHFGEGNRNFLPQEMKNLSIRHPLFVTDKGVVDAGVFAMAIDSLEPNLAYSVFDSTPPNPTEDAALDGLSAYHKHSCDGIIGVGGGASLDLAKAIAVLVGDPAPLWEYCNRNPQPRPIKNTPPLILMPTTSGTGSEVGRSAVIIFRHGIKAGVGCPQVVSVAICDPELTYQLPPDMTAATGMDALTHCVETFCSPIFNPPADAIALDGLKRIYFHINGAVERGASDKQARQNLMMGALEGAICFQKGLGAVHSLSHALGAQGYHHGTLNAIFLPHVLAINADAIFDKMTMMATAMHLPADADLPLSFARLNSRIGLPQGLKSLGVDQADFEAIASAALEDNAHKTNPKVLTRDDYLNILRAAY